MDFIESRESDRAVGRAVVPSSEETVTLPPTQSPYQSLRREGKHRNSQSYSRQDRSSRCRGGMRGAVGL